MQSGASPDIESLMQRRIAGHALERDFYTDPAVFDLDLRRVLLRHWFCAAHVSSIPRAGDYTLVDLGSESLIIVRTADDDIKALLNVCRHRGSRVATARAGRAAAGRFVCPYHAWTYDSSGALIVAREMADDFDRSRYGLKSLPVRVAEGLIFTTFAAEPLDFAPAARALSQSLGVHGWAGAKVAHQATYSMNANWKLAVENYMECYHCQPAHAEFARRHVYARPAAQSESFERAGRARAEFQGIRIADVDQYGCAALPGAESVSVFRSALIDGVQSATPDDRSIARLMGNFDRHDGNSTYVDIGPISDFLAYADYGVIYRFVPRSVQHTDLEVIWLVHAEAVEGKDYEVGALSWLWTATSLEDKRIVELNQAGVNSRLFEPGPYSRQEPFALRFVEWYLSEVAAAPP